MSTDLLIINGPGVVARRGSAVLWAESTDLRREGLLAVLVARLRELPEGTLSPQDYADWLVGELAGPHGATVPALAFTVPDDGQVLVVVHGWGRVTAPGGTVTAQGAPHRIPSALPIALGRADLAVIASGNSLLDLEAGVVPGGAALLLARPAQPAQVAQPEPAQVAQPEPVAGRHLAPDGPGPDADAPFRRPEPVAEAAAPEVPSVSAPSPSLFSPGPQEPAPSPWAAPSERVSFAGPATPERTPEPRPEPTPEPAAPAVAAGPVHTPPPGPRTPPPGIGLGGVSLVSLRPEASEPAPAREPLPIAQPAPPVTPDGPPPAPEPPPTPAGPRAAIVPGVRCARQHFNNPSALYCRVCGISMLQQTHVQVQGERPPLGVLVCDDGSTYGLDGDYAIGADPRAEPGVVSGLAQPLVLGDPAAGVAPTHVIIHLDGWEVLVLNRSPGLPAAVLHRGDTQWTPLPPGQWARLAPGSYVGFAGRHVVFESNNRA